MALDPYVIIRPMEAAGQALLRGAESGSRNFLAAMQAAEQRKMREQQQARQNRLAQLAQESFTPGQEALPSEPAMGPVRPGERLPDYPAQPAREPQFDVRGFQNRLLGAGMVPEAMQVSKFATGTDQRIGTYNPRDYTTESWSEFTKTGDPSKLKRYTEKTIMIGEVPHKLVPGTENTYVPLSSLGEEAEAARELEKSKGIGKATAKNIGKAAEQIPKISENIRNLDEVIRLIEEEGAVTGPVASKFPSFRKASIQLDNMRRRLGLDVIGSVTFGALSKAELSMALSTALPTQLKGQDLVDWARRKRDAQAKLRDYMQEQVNFLSQPGNTMADWYEHMQGRNKEQQQGQIKFLGFE